MRWIFLFLTCMACDLSTSGPCLKAGEEGDREKPPNPACCWGLAEVSREIVPGDPWSEGLPEGCTQEDPSPGYDFTCSDCGNGECATGENFCNCPEDCERPSE